MTIFVFKLRTEATVSISGYMTARLIMPRGNVEDPWDENLCDNSGQSEDLTAVA